MMNLTFTWKAPENPSGDASGNPDHYFIYYQTGSASYVPEKRLQVAGDKLTLTAPMDVVPGMRFRMTAVNAQGIESAGGNEVVLGGINPPRELMVTVNIVAPLTFTVPVG